jgi:hypothetical protein
MSLSRRNFLKSATATSVAFAGLPALAGCARADGITQPWLNQVEGYGELVADPAGLFDLPEGFAYEVISTVGDAMTDGLVAPVQTANGSSCAITNSIRTRSRSRPSGPTRPASI